MTDITICRTAHCRECEEHGVGIGDIFLTKKRFKKNFDKRASIIYTKSGMTPHAFTLERAKDGMVYGTMICLVVGCGIEIVEQGKGKYSVFHYPTKVKEFSFTVKNWNDLMNYRDESYHLDK